MNSNQSAALAVATLVELLLKGHPATSLGLQSQDQPASPIEELKLAFAKFEEDHTRLAESVSALSKTIPPIGSILAFAGSTTPEGWIACDGSEFDADDPQYKPLFAAIGNAYGGRKPHFRVPDFQGRVTVGAGQGKTVNAQGQETLLSLRTRGDYFGNERHKLEGLELPAHTHGAHHHIWLWGGGGSNLGCAGGYDTAVRSARTGGIMGIDHNTTQPGKEGGYITSDDGNTAVVTADVAEKAFETLPPSCVVNYLIRYK